MKTESNMQISAVMPLSDKPWTLRALIGRWLVMAGLYILTGNGASMLVQYFTRYTITAIDPHDDELQEQADALAAKRKAEIDRDLPGIVCNHVLGSTLEANEKFQPLCASDDLDLRTDSEIRSDWDRLSMKLGVGHGKAR